MNYQTVAQNFVKFYYTTFDTNRAGVLGLYTDQSVMTWLQSSYQGAKQIEERLSSLSFSRCVHDLANLNYYAQPMVTGGILISVYGQMKADDDEPMKFTQTFHLMSKDGSNFFILNEIFELILFG